MRTRRRARTCVWTSEDPILTVLGAMMDQSATEPAHAHTHKHTRTHTLSFLSHRHLPLHSSRSSKSDPGSRPVVMAGGGRRMGHGWKFSSYISYGLTYSSSAAFLFCSFASFKSSSVGFHDIRYGRKHGAFLAATPPSPSSPPISWQYGHAASSPSITTRSSH